MKQTQRFTFSALALSGILAGAGLALTTEDARAAVSERAVADDLDTLVLKSGRSIKGRILEETDDSIRFMIVFSSGLEAEQSYDRSEILSIDRAEKAEADAPAEAAAPVDNRRSFGATPGDQDAAKVYVLELDGVFGRGISQTPIRDAVKDAERKGAEYLVFVMNNDWYADPLGWSQLSNDQNLSFDELWRTEDMDPIFVREIPLGWENPPKVVFWIKNAMGGAAFLPLNCEDIYFHPDARLGGVGNLFELFGDLGDEVVRQKQYSLRLGHAQGMANCGGHDPKIVQALCEREYVLSYKKVGDEVVFLEREPQAPDEFLLTDDGKDENEDTERALARNEGNDILTLDAKTAYALGVSKGTVESIDDLMWELGIARNYKLVEGTGQRILDKWEKDIDEADWQIRRMFIELDEIEGDNVLARRMSKLRDIRGIFAKYAEVLDPNGQYRSQIDVMLYQHELQLMLENLQERRQRRLGPG